MEKTIFWLDRMDNHSQEYRIRIALFPICSIKNIEFNLVNRTLVVYHKNGLNDISAVIKSLNLGEQEITTDKIDNQEFYVDANQTSLLWTIFGISLTLLFLELSTGISAGSMSLMASSLYLLGDSILYPFGLFGFNSTFTNKARTVRIFGYTYLFLASLGMFEILRRTQYSVTLPDYSVMAFIAILALMINLFCLYLLRNSKLRNKANMSFKSIFTSQNILINIGILLAAGFTSQFQNELPDMVISSIIYLLIIAQAWRILKLGQPVK